MPSQCDVIAARPAAERGKYNLYRLCIHFLMIETAVKFDLTTCSRTKLDFLSFFYILIASGAFSLGVT